MGRIAASALADKQLTCTVCDRARLAAAKKMVIRASGALHLVRQRVAANIEALTREQIAQAIHFMESDKAVSPPLVEDV